MAKVYALKPIVTLPDHLSLPKVMYDLSDIQDVGKINDITDDFSRQKDIQEYHLLETRQVGILKKLKEMKQHIEFLRVAIRLSNIIKISYVDLPFINRKNQSSENCIYIKVIVSVNPRNPPYAILALQRIWNDTKFNIDIYRHSTLIDPIINKFEEMLLTKAKNEIIHNVDIKLIWKDVPNFQFNTNINNYPLHGEANFLRYLTRLIKKYDYENSKVSMCTDAIDTILDLCLRFSCRKPKNTNDIMLKFVSYLSKNPWLLNYSNPSIVDIAAWSIIKQKLHERIPCELKKWYDLCEKIFTS